MSSLVTKTVITLEESSTTVEVTYKDGLKEKKNSNIENIQQIFMKEQAMETPLLPSQWGVVKYYRKNNYEGYVLTTPPTEREVTFDVHQSEFRGTRIVPIPPMLWIFEVQNGDNDKKKLTHSMAYVLKHELLSFNDVVLHAPFPNIGVNHGICWGKENPPVPSSKSIQNIPARFFGQPFNFDLASSRVQEFLYNFNGAEQNTDSAFYHMHLLAKQLEEAKENDEAFNYPFDTLKTAGTSRVKDAVKTYMPSIFR